MAEVESASGAFVAGRGRRLGRGVFFDGSYGTKTVQAVRALEKLAGIPVDGNWGPLDELLVKVYEPGAVTPRLISHASSGNGRPWRNEEHSGTSITPQGDFHIDRRIVGWRQSSLGIGGLYNPLYFRGGIALHGSRSVPLYPASHGCVRLPMHIAEYRPDELPDGTPLHVLD